MTAAVNFKQGKTPLGHLLIATQGDALIYADFGETPEALLSKFRLIYPEASVQSETDPLLEKAWSAYINYLSQPEALLEIPVRPTGTAFQEQVWQALLQMPTGSRQTYATLAEAIGQPTAARAVASACARNTIALRIPCHRILRSDGALGGYRWGLAMKRRLLSAERQSDFFKRSQLAAANLAEAE